MPRTSKSVSYHQRILRVLAADGGWHSLEEIYAAVVRFVPAEAAAKEYAKRRPNADGVKQADRVAQGRKRLVFLSLNSAIHHRKTVIARGRDWSRKYRLTKAALEARRADAPKAATADQ